ncbi:hypothetical protein D8Y20_02990 [Mariprofundus sp. EBB-1]|uniref:hypothetical protein n=1 Tax=Mariprofundus sp. EBB-1 TaxID=2650971 RepID=UPI000EF26F62|nr:hypothetical protein [Mariprofundus sp. EBB-1]RLL54759.1 hypothetical protein D8Y20_02990 [Mariprofundus sp. EBB-1]
MTTKTKDPENNTAPAEDNLAGVGNVDQIRDIIFGSQMRDYESRFQRLEERLLNELTTVRNETSTRVDALESYMRNEMDALNSRQSKERDERESDDKELSEELKQLSKELLKKLSQLDDSVTNQNRELRDQLLNQSKSLSTEIHSTREQLNNALVQATNELQHNKTDRASLAELLSEMALRLKDEFPLPSSK